MLSSPSPLVSVLIPFYNAHQYVRETVQSVFQQSYENIEIIIVNDGSRLPRVKDLLGDFDLSRINFIDHETNQGLAAARNTAFHASKGDLILPLDADDLIHPDFLIKTVSKLQESEDLSAVYTQVKIFGDVEMIWSPNATLARLMSGLPIPSTVLFRRSVFEKAGGFNQNIKSSPDVDFWIRVFALGLKVHQIDEPLYLYRKYSGSLSDEGKLTEVEAIVAENATSFFDNLEEVCSVLNNKYEQLDSDLRTLKDGYIQLFEGNCNLRKRYEDVVEQLVKRKIVSPPAPLVFENSREFEQAFKGDSTDEFVPVKNQELEFEKWIQILGLNERKYFRKKARYGKIEEEFKRLETEYLLLHSLFDKQVEILKKLGLKWKFQNVLKFKIFQ